MQRRWSTALLANLAVFSAVCFGGHPAKAADDEAPVWVFQIENDFFTQLTNTDRHYTNGVRFSRVSPPGDVPGWLGAMAAVPSSFGPAGEPSSQRWAASIGHSIFTPDDTDAVALVPDDRPYAAWLYLGFAVYSDYLGAQGAARHDVFSIEAGIVGPSALGEEIQNTYHKLIGVDLSNGWDNQLRDEPGLKLGFARKWRTAHWDLSEDGHYEADLIPHISLSLGNIVTDAGAGGLVRLGENLHDDFGPPRIRPGLPGSESFERTGSLDWYVFAGAELRAVAHDIFLDGNTWKDSHSVDREPFVADLQAGLALLFDRFRLTYTHVFVSPEFRQQSQWDQYGAITLSFNF
jgi:hypothetical protein